MQNKGSVAKSETQKHYLWQPSILTQVITNSDNDDVLLELFAFKMIHLSSLTNLFPYILQ